MPVARQAMVNLSPHQLDDVREITVEEHDKGLNLRSCPFTRTCWVMFLAFPLDFQTRSIISQAVGLFGDVITWTDNSRCKSRILLRCKVTLVSRIPRSLIISEGSTVGATGNSWTVPVFVLDSHLNDIEPADEDQIPPNGNPHPDNLHFNANPGDHPQGQFEDVGDLDQVQQENVNHGWEVPPAPPQGNNMDWEPWPQQDGELVAENELANVQNLADAAVENAVAAGLMQHPDQPQDNHSVSSETNAFFRAQGTPVTLELPLPDTSSSRALTVFQQSSMTFDSDYLVRELAKSLGLHQSFGPVPSVEMLLQDLALRAHGLHHRLALKTQLPWHS
jgi:hypothetical protein